MTSNEIRNYNKEVQVYQNKARELLAKKDYTQKELLKLCSQLSELTGMQVTPENLESVYQAQMAQFQQTLKTGREIIERAKAEEQSLATGGNVGASPVENSTANMNGMGNMSQTPFTQGNMGGVNGMGQVPFGQNNQSSQGIPQPQSMPGFGQFSNSPFGQSYDAHGKVGQL